MLTVNELQIDNDFLTAVAPKRNGNTNTNINLNITPGAIPTCETSPVEESEGTLMGQLLYGHIQSICLAPMLSAAEKLQNTLSLLSFPRPAVRKPEVVAQVAAPLGCTPGDRCGLRQSDCAGRLRFGRWFYFRRYSGLPACQGRRRRHVADC